MFDRSANPALAFADTRAGHDASPMKASWTASTLLLPLAALVHPSGHAADWSLAGTDPVEQMALADAADWTLLRLVLCAATATLVLAIASSFGL